MESSTYEGSLAALGDGTRRAIFARLAEGPASVNEIARGLPVSRPAVSQHLRVLSDARLVDVRRHGKQRIYRLRAETLRVLRDHFEELWHAARTHYGDRELASRSA